MSYPLFALKGNRLWSIIVVLYVDSDKTLADDSNKIFSGYISKPQKAPCLSIVGLPNGIKH